MKRSKIMKLIGILACLCLITSCFVGSTLAKYVTGASANDTARVAKFGVSVTAGGDLFGTTYQATTNNNPGTGGAGETLTVESSNGDKLIAPGTKNDTGMAFSLSGTPEVKVSVDFTFTGTTDVFLKAGTYSDETTASDATDTFAVAADYHPVKFTLKKNGTAVSGAENVSLATLATTINGLDATYDALTDLSTETYTITWAWDFDNSGAGTYDKEDTVLGNLAAGTYSGAALTDGTDYELDLAAAIQITVTQVD